jgi:hypothetical protein
MKEQSEGESHEIVDSIQERETLWKQFVARQDCENCPQRKSFLRLKTTACLRCFEKHRNRLAAQPSS